MALVGVSGGNTDDIALDMCAVGIASVGKLYRQTFDAIGGKLSANLARMGMDIG